MRLKLLHIVMRFKNHSLIKLAFLQAFATHACSLHTQ